MIFIYTTCREETIARSLAARVIEQKLAVRVNIWRIGSIFQEDGALKEEKGVAMLIKTLESKVQAIEDFILKNTDHGKPFIGVLDVRRANRGYKEWVSWTIN